MRSDTLKLLFSNLIAFLVIGGGGYILWDTYSDPSAQNLQLVISGFIGAAITYVFQSENQTRTARLQEKALLTGVTNGYATPQPVDPAEPMAPVDT